MGQATEARGRDARWRGALQDARSLQSSHHVRGGLGEVELGRLGTRSFGDGILVEGVLLHGQAAALTNLGGAVRRALTLGTAMPGADLMLLLSNEVLQERKARARPLAGTSSISRTGIEASRGVEGHARVTRSSTVMLDDTKEATTGAM